MKWLIVNTDYPDFLRQLYAADAALAGRPDLMRGRSSLTLAEGMAGMQENIFINMKNKSFTITADVEIPQQTRPVEARGLVVARAGRRGIGDEAHMRVGQHRRGPCRRILLRLHPAGQQDSQA